MVVAQDGLPSTLIYFAFVVVAKVYLGLDFNCQALATS